MSEYLKIISQWGSKAQEGRNQAKKEQEMLLKTKQLEYQNLNLEEQTQQVMEQRMSNIHAQAEELAKHYRPQDLENMKTVSEQAQNEIKSQLEYYGDDLVKFMRRGGAQHLNNYRDAILNSEEAKIIRNNHQELTKYLDAMDQHPDLVSRIDQRGFEDWKSGKHDKFVFHGEYQKLDEPESIEGYASAGEAFLDTKNNLAKALYNYNIDTNQNYTLTDVQNLGLKDELINYINTTQTPIMEKKNYQEELAGYKAGSKKASDHFKMVNDNINRGFTGDFGPNGALFWDDASNWNARTNLTQFAGAGAFGKGSGDMYTAQIFPGQQQKIAAHIFGFTDKNGKIDPSQLNGEIHRSHINSLLANGAITAYDTNGNSVENTGGRDWWFGGNDFQLVGMEYGLEVATDRANNKFKLLTNEDINAEGEDAGLYKNKSKDGAVLLVLKDKDWIGKDDYIYLKLDMNNAYVAKKFNDSVGEVDYTSRQVAETSPGEFVYSPGEQFKFTVPNVTNAITGLHNELDVSMKKAGVTEFDKLTYSTILAHSLQYQQDGINPTDFINEITSTDEATAKEAFNELKEGDVAGYLKVFENSGQLSKNEVKRLQRDIQAIINGYTSLSVQ